MIAIWKALGLALQIGGASPVLTLDSAIEVAEANAFSLKIADSAISRTQQAVNQAKATGGPQVSAGATYSRFDRTQFSIPGQGSSPKDSKNAEISFSFPIDLSGNIKRGVNIAKLVEESSRLNREAARVELRNQVRRSFFQVLQATELVRLSERSLKLSQERLQNTEKLFQGGVVPKVEVLRAQTLVSLSQTDLTNAENRLTLAKQSLNNTLGRSIETDFEPEPFKSMMRTETGPSDLMQLAWTARPDVKELEVRGQTLKFVRETERRGLQPSMAVAARHQRDFGDFGAAGKTSTTGTLSLSVPLHDSGITRARVKQAQEDEKQNKILLDQLKLRVELQIRAALASLRDAESRLKSARTAVELSEETFRLATIQFEAGVGIQLEVSDAQTDLVQAQTNLINAKYDYLIAWADLQRALGRDDVDGKVQPLEAGN